MVIAVGSKAPQFTLKNQFGESVSLRDLLSKSPVVLVFYPLSFSGICTGELCELRDNMAVFNDSHAQLVGISVDSHFVQRVFADREGYDFPVLADFWPHGDVAKQFGVFIEDRGIADRATFVIDQGGTIVAEFVTEPGKPRDVAQYREALAALPA